MAWLLFLVILLYPVAISELPFERPLRPLKAEPTRQTKEAAKPEIRLEDFPEIDRDAFLTSFARQSHEFLVPCLKSQGERTGTLSFLSRLNKQGKLTSIRLIDSKIAKECVIEALQKMDFKPVVQKMEKSTVEIAWRFEW